MDTGHKTDLRPLDSADGPPYWAFCVVCGWRGPLRETVDEAARDGGQHEATENHPW